MLIVTNKCLSKFKPNQVLKRYAASRVAETVFITKNIEEPVLCVTDKENVDMIGPPDPISNLRPIIRKVLLHETALQQRLRLMQDETQRWNQKFWSEHNTKFIKERQEYTSSHLKPNEDRKTLTADEMSEFYKAFLDKNWRTHVNYNLEWYKRNLILLLLALRVNLEAFVRHS